ncbi:hypothetical protein [Nonomuraea typhae]|uniref:hypothetical protein n=1 Tax=Nonomuraea typhae TaxID=2603600 RepID=UPI001CA5C5EE|nr:hypothetical protein [Nonomuraea typhae]
MIPTGQRRPTPTAHHHGAPPAMSPSLRKLILTTHITTSVGWLGAVLAYLALDLTATLSTDTPAVRSAYTAMDVLVRFAIVPLAVASLAVGLVNALGTPWGLVRHYWVVVKFVLTAAATVVLVVESRTVSSLAEAGLTSADPRLLPTTLPHSIGGTAVLVIATVLSVYKPRGLTRYGWRRRTRPERLRSQIVP